MILAFALDADFRGAIKNRNLSSDFFFRISVRWETFQNVSTSLNRIRDFGEVFKIPLEDLSRQSTLIPRLVKAGKIVPKLLMPLNEQ